MSRTSNNRGNVELKCAECNFIIRPTSRNKANIEGKLTLNKHCPKCRKTTVFKEK